MSQGERNERSSNPEGSFNRSSWAVSLLYHADCTPPLWRECQLHPVSYLSPAPVSTDSVWAGVISQSEALGDCMTLCHTTKWDCVIQERVKRKCAYAAEPEANCPDLDTQQLGYLYSFTHSCLYGNVLHVFVGVFSRWWVCVNINGNLYVSALFTKTLRGAVQQILIQLKWLKIKY